MLGGPHHTIGRTRSTRHRVTTTVLALLAALATLVGPTTVGTAGAAPATTESTSVIDTSCDGHPVQVPVQWYFPPSGTAPTALVWLQHGFLRSPSNLATMAKAYARNGFLVADTGLNSLNLAGCAVAYNIANNAAFARTIAKVPTTPGRVWPS